MLTPVQAAAVIAVMAAVTFLTREGNPPRLVLYLGRVLPPAIIAMLIVYCLRGVNPSGLESWLPPLLAVLLVVGLHRWKHNNLISIFGGTIFYMVLVQAVDWQAVQDAALIFFN